MQYRRLELTLPHGDSTDIGELCGDMDLLHHQVLNTAEGEPRRISMLLRNDASEPVLSKLQECFGDREGFRAEVITLAAVVPRPNEEEEASPDEAENQEDQANKELARGRISREELLNDLEPGTNISRIYLLTVLLSSIIAAVGLVRDNAAVVIGAMVIAPLLMPNMSLALGTTLGDFKMMWRSLLTNVVGVAVCLGFAIGVGLLVPFDPGVREIASRTEVGMSDVVLALAAGTAGAVAVTSGVSANLIGVMVAVALLPPMVAFGLLLGDASFELAGGTGLLLAVNLTCVNLAAVATFLVRGIRPSTFYDKVNAKKASITALLVWLTILLGTVLIIWLSQADG
ncbi:MAG: TIGR00341 family protein [Planctomycetota bacterium]